MTTFSIKTLGCKVNQFESETLEQALVDQGYRPADGDEAADLCIINTCTVTQKASINHQGVLAEAASYPYATLDQVLARAEGKPRALIIALDHITDPGNLGAIVRTAEVVGADGVLVAKRRAAAVTPAAYKSSAGALAHVALAQEANLAQSLERCKEAGFWIAGASEHAEQTRLGRTA